MLAAQEDIASKIVEIAKRKDMTIYQTVNDILEQAVRVDEIGLTIKQVVDERWKLERAREIGFTFTVEHLIYLVADAAYEENPERFTQIWRDMGHWYGKYFNGKHDDPVDAFRDALELFTIGSSEYDLSASGKELTLSFIGEKLTPGYTSLFTVFIEELLAVLGYKLNGKEIQKGLIKLGFKR